MTGEELDRAAIPDAEAYFQAHGLVLRGAGKWRTAACPFHGGSDSLRVNTETSGWTCMACGQKGGDMLAFHMQWHGLPFVEAARELGALTGQKRAMPARHAPPRSVATVLDGPEHAVLSDYGRQLWGASSHVAGTTGQAYLQARHCVLPPEDGDLRFHPRLRHPTGYEGPALIALITDAVTGEPISLHRTWVSVDGTKPVDPPRLPLKGHRKKGGVIRLWPDEAVTMGLGVAEGIETALSLAHAYQPVWSVIDAGNLGDFPVLSGIEALVVGADNDDAGRRGAYGCANRWAAAGVQVLVTRQAENDLNDVVRRIAA